MQMSETWGLSGFCAFGGEANRVSATAEMPSVIPTTAGCAPEGLDCLRGAEMGFDNFGSGGGNVPLDHLCAEEPGHLDFPLCGDYDALEDWDCTPRSTGAGKILLCEDDSMRFGGECGCCGSHSFGEPRSPLQTSPLPSNVLPEYRRALQIGLECGLESIECDGLPVPNFPAVDPGAGLRDAARRPCPSRNVSRKTPSTADSQRASLMRSIFAHEGKQGLNNSALCRPIPLRNTTFRRQGPPPDDEYRAEAGDAIAIRLRSRTTRARKR